MEYVLLYIVFMFLSPLLAGYMERKFDISGECPVHTIAFLGPFSFAILLIVTIGMIACSKVEDGPFNYLYKVGRGDK